MVGLFWLACFRASSTFCVHSDVARAAASVSATRNVTLIRLRYAATKIKLQEKSEAAKAL